ncbi:MAG: GntR family transcriptional regulator [Deltaproteobacteria bacterium]|nr:GntR family transcriptional regulator [Deltaproteobacteria bacterium]
MELSLTEHLNLSERVFKLVEKAVLKGSIKPGHRIIETDLAKSLGTSKSPVREALKRLEGEGVVELVPRRGYIVREITRKGVDDFFDIMMILEPAIACMSYRKRKPESEAVLDGFIQRMEKKSNKRDFEEYLVLNDQFHMYFYSVTENDWVTKIALTLRRQAEILRSLSLYTKDRCVCSIEEHRNIVTAWKSGNETALIQAVKNHLTLFKENIYQAEHFKK